MLKAVEMLQDNTYDDLDDFEELEEDSREL